MKIAIPRERRAFEARVAATPDTVKKYKGLGFDVAVEAGAGAGASIPDSAFAAAGAAIVDDPRALLADADIVLKVQRPLTAGEGDLDELGAMKRGAVLIASLSPYQARESLDAYAAAGVEAHAMELIPRITRAQSMDILSSQANLAGYKAVLDAASEYGRAFPMMMTAAGTVAPAKLFVLGVGVAGLQAIATARRLGAIVSAFDVRAATKEQVKSLGATFLEVEGMEDLETKAGYAREASEEQKQRQAAKITEHLAKQDIVICTAQIPGRQAPRLVTAEMIRGMKPGAVIVDLAVESGGNAEGSKPGEIVVTENGVKLVGHRNVPGRLAQDASALYAKNLLNYITPMVDRETKALKVAYDDEIVKGTLLTRDGAVVHPSFAAQPAAASA
ncbi:MAG TPA: Re/Si-specific NAD(P)(+) transhydrogenase subunit alpha [Alphaproteobacteria bacterium]|nr:Re/Si-specific NAD(P)(+) transhydrogenase subunit alpha [Alphaproteobacteria bacterium]